MKLFATGAPRTGLATLTEALNIMGIKTLQFPYPLYYDINHKIIHRYDGFTDLPIPILYKELDALHPGSKFVHTIREEPSWLRSAQWLFTTGAVKFEWRTRRLAEIIDTFHLAFYGLNKFDETQFLKTYRRHNQEVLDYFAKRPRDFLLLDIAAKEGFDKLCPFLNAPVPKIPFPHRNKQEGITKVRLRKLLSIMKTKIKSHMPRTRETY